MIALLVCLTGLGFMIHALFTIGKAHSERSFFIGLGLLTVGNLLAVLIFE